MCDHCCGFIKKHIPLGTLGHHSFGFRGGRKRPPAASVLKVMATSADDHLIRTSCPRDCYDACGIVVVKRRGETRVLGDPEHPVSRGVLCGKCAIAYNGAWRDPA